MAKSKSKPPAKPAKPMAGMKGMGAMAGKKSMAQMKKGC